MIRNPGDIDCTTETTPTFDNCYFISNVDNGWYASGLIVVRQAHARARASWSNSLIAPMNFGLFYDDRAETHCNVNPAIPGNQPTGQMFGGYYVGLPPDQGDNWTHYYHNGALYSDPRISAYIGMGLHQMPGNVWWRSWRELPPPAPFADCQTTDPDFSWQGQWPMPGSWQTYTDPQSGQQFPVWEGHYTYPGSDLTFIPTFAGGMFEGLMANEVVPETSWGPHSFGLADASHRRGADQVRHRAAALPGLGHVAVQHARRHRRLRRLRRRGADVPVLRLRRRRGPPQPWPLAVPWLRDRGRCDAACVLPCAGRRARRRRTPTSKRCASATRASTVRAVSSTPSTPRPARSATGYLVLDQSMIMAALDNALSNRALQRHFASDPVSWAARTYLGIENLGLG